MSIVGLRDKRYEVTFRKKDDTVHKNRANFQVEKKTFAGQNVTFNEKSVTDQTKMHAKVIELIDSEKETSCHLDSFELPYEAAVEGQNNTVEAAVELRRSNRDR